MGYYNRLSTITTSHFLSNKYLLLFLIVFGLRHIRVVSNVTGNDIYRPMCIPRKAKHKTSDVTVMIATLGLNSTLLHQVAESILVHPVAKLIIVASSPGFEQQPSPTHESSLYTPHTQVVDERQSSLCHISRLPSQFFRTIRLPGQCHPISSRSCLPLLKTPRWVLLCH